MGFLCNVHTNFLIDNPISFSVYSRWLLVEKWSFRVRIFVFLYVVGLRHPFWFAYWSYYRSHLFFFPLIPVLLIQFTLRLLFISFLTPFILMVCNLSPLLPGVGLRNSLFLAKPFHDVFASHKYIIIYLWKQNLYMRVTIRGNTITIVYILTMFLYSINNCCYQN